MDDYFLVKEDWDSIVELGLNTENLIKDIPSNVKSAFTRA